MTQISDPKKQCKKCKGKKVQEISLPVEVSIEPGCPTDHIIKYNGMGNEIPGAEAGDLVVKVGVKKHKQFERNGADLKDLIISSVPGEVIEFGAAKSVKGKGLPFYKDKMSHGNLIIKFSVKFPKANELTEDVRAAIEKVRLT